MMKEKIELTLKREPDKDNDRNVHIPCHIYGDREEEVHKLAVLKECLFKVGIELTADRGEVCDYLNFAINFEKFDKITGRNAGRKKDKTMKDRYKPCTVSQLKMKLNQGMKKSEIIQELGCPKPTFYRILKHLDGLNWDWEFLQDCSIWEFTGK